MSNRIGVIDLGTNTFHLLVVEKSNHWGRPFQEVHRERAFVKLAEDGIEKIGTAPFQRGLKTLRIFAEILNKLEVTQVKAIGTAALRTASNGMDFVRAAHQESGIEIELINGDREADLIYKGIQQSILFKEDNKLIMDIGGGSVEFIVANQNGVQWAQSFPIGAMVLYRRFHNYDPIQASDVQALENHLDNVLSGLYKVIEQHPVRIMIGASGTFDVLEEVLDGVHRYDLYSQFPAASFYPFFKKVLPSTHAERYAMAEIPDERADLIVVALILIDVVLKRLDIETIMVSPFALKEGVIWELMKE